MQEIKEKTADEMFKELGYEKIIESNVRIDYEREGLYFDKEIVFGLIDKIICVELGTGESTNINMQELQAINKKVEELRWI